MTKAAKATKEIATDIDPFNFRTSCFVIHELYFSEWERTSPKPHVDMLEKAEKKVKSLHFSRYFLECYVLRMMLRCWLSSYDSSQHSP
jgi:hypothetical protein